MKHVVEGLAAAIAAISWLAGIVLVKGWLTAVAVCVPPYAWYLVVERAMVIAGLA